MTAFQMKNRIPFRSHRLILHAVLPGLLAIPVALPAQTRPAPPNIVFFLVDDLGWRDVGCYGSEFYETPNVDRLARDGVRFTQAYAACHVCSPTRASIMSGKENQAV